MNNYKLMKRIRGDHSLLPNEKLIALILATYRNHRNGLCNPGQRALAKDSGYSQTTVYRILKKLAEKKVVTNKNKPRCKPYYQFYSDSLKQNQKLIQPMLASEQHDNNFQDLIWDRQQDYHDQHNELSERMLQQEVEKTYHQKTSNEPGLSKARAGL